MPYSAERRFIQQGMTARNADISNIAFFIDRYYENDFSLNTGTLCQFRVCRLNSSDKFGFLNIAAHSDRIPFHRSWRWRRRYRSDTRQQASNDSARNSSR